MRPIKEFFMGVIIFILVPATFGAFLLHDKFKQEAYVENNLSKLNKAVNNQKVWVLLGFIIDIIKLFLIF